MAESYSVRAILSAKDRGFTSAMNGALGTVGTLGSKIRSGLGFGILAGVGMAAFNSLTNGARGLISEMNNATKTWKTFTSNMEILGKSSSEITKVKKELQSFAQETIFSSSDMASTYAQLASVGTKNTLELVKGFGGLAAAAEDPAQAMKTLSQQATQMAARPTVAWQDYKLMLEQTPAGMAAVAKEMGMSAQELTAKIQGGEIATEDFFDAIEKVGTSDAFSSLARQYKTADEAMDGLRETIGNKLQPAWEAMSAIAAGSISKIIDAVSTINADKLAVKLKRFVYFASKYWAVFKDDLSEIKSAFGDAFSAIGDSLSGLNGAFGSTESVEGFASTMDVVKNALVGIAGFLKSNADIIAVLIKNLPKLILAFIGFKVLTGILGPVMALSGLFGGLGKKTKTAEKGVTSLKSGFNSLQKSAGIALIIASLALLAKAITPLASLGTTAIAPLLAFGVVVAGLGIVFAIFGPQLQKSVIGIVAFALSMSILALAMAPIASTGKEGAIAMAAFGIVVAGLVVVFALLGPALIAAIPGMLALGAAALLVGAGMALASSFISALPPVIEQLGDTASQVASAVSSAFALMCDGAATVVDAISGGVTSVLTAISGVIDSIGIAAANAGIGFEKVALGIQTIAGLSIIDVAASLTAVATGMAAIAASGPGMATAAASTLVMVAALSAARSQMDGIASATSNAISALSSIQGAVKGASGSLSSLASTAKSSLSAVSAAFNSLASTAKTAGNAAGNGFTSELKSGLSKAPVFTATAVSAVIAKLRSGRPAAYSAGVYISQGFAQGMLSYLSTIQAAAAKMVTAADAAIRAKAQIRSPAKLSTEEGEYWGEGWVNGILSKVNDAWAAAQRLVSLPTVSIPNLAVSYGGEMNADYEYSSNADFLIEVPLTVDGKEFARATATYTQDEIERQQNRSNRKRGVV